MRQHVQFVNQAEEQKVLFFKWTNKSLRWHPGSSLGSPPSGRHLEHLPWEASRALLYRCLILLSWLLSTSFILAEEINFTGLDSGPCLFGSIPKVLGIDPKEGNIGWPVGLQVLPAPFSAPPTLPCQTHTTTSRSLLPSLNNKTLRYLTPPLEAGALPGPGGGKPSLTG